MKKYAAIAYCLLFLILFINGCATAQSYTKQGTDFSKYKKISVIKFDCSNPAVGQEVADIVALMFIKKNYNIVERSQLRAIIDENLIISSGLTDSAKSALKLAGINAVIVGSVTRYDCHPDKVVAMIGFTPIFLNTNNCHASLSLKMLDASTGEILWAANGSHAINDSHMTAYKVLQKVTDILEDQIP